jgi:hypothetical protein
MRIVANTSTVASLQSSGTAKYIFMCVWHFEPTPGVDNGLEAGASQPLKPKLVVLAKSNVRVPQGVDFDFNSRVS